MQTINVRELKNLDSTVSSIDHFHSMGWALSTHYMEITTGMMSHLVNWHHMVPENGKDDIVQALLEMAPELA